MSRPDVPGGAARLLSLAGRSLLAVLAGFAAAVVIVMVATAVGVLLFFGGDFTAAPTPTWIAVNLTYTGLAGGVGGWLAARLAPRHPVAHAVGVALIMVGMSLGGGEAAPTAGVPAWYGTAVTVLGGGGAVAGGLLRSLAAGKARPSTARRAPAGQRPPGEDPPA